MNICVSCKVEYESKKGYWEIDSIKIQSTGIFLSIFSSSRLTDQSCNLKQIGNFSSFFFFSFSRIFRRVTIKDNSKVTFHTKQITTNILIGEYIEPIVLVYQGLLYTLYIWTLIYVCVCVVIALTLFVCRERERGNKMSIRVK